MPRVSLEFILMLGYAVSSGVASLFYWNWRHVMRIAAR